MLKHKVTPHNFFVEISSKNFNTEIFVLPFGILPNMPMTFPFKHFGKTLLTPASSCQPEHFLEHPLVFPCLTKC